MLNLIDGFKHFLALLLHLYLCYHCFTQLNLQTASESNSDWLHVLTFRTEHPP